MSDAGDTISIAQSQKTTVDVFSRCDELKELDDGYELQFPRTAAWSEKLRLFTAGWNRSCPHMSFEVQPGDQGPIVLHIRGPDGTKQFVEGARYMLTSHFNPAPTLRHKLRQASQLITSPLRALPDFLIIGAKKCGTTALYSYLTQHPRIVPALKKEVYYFNACYGRGNLWYRSHFPTRASKGTQLTGEATPDYLFDRQCAERIKATVPRAKLIAILRNPVDRAYSFYNHNLRAGLETRSFEDAIAKEEEQLAGGAAGTAGDDPDFDLAHHSYLRRGIYVDQLTQWEGHFPRAQMCVLRTEGLTEQPEETLETAFGFLGLPYHAPEAFKKLNAAPYPDMDPAVRARLQRFFEPHNARLQQSLDQDMRW